MTTRLKVLLVILGLLTAFASGRFLAPTKVKTVTQIVEVEKKSTKTDTVDKGSTVTTIVKRPDGTSTTTITHQDNKDTKTSENDTKDTNETISKEVTRDPSKTTISALAGVNVTKAGLPDYGLSVSRPVLGPVAVTVFGFRSGMIGAGLGLSF